MEGLTKLLLTSIFDALLERSLSGRCSVSWGYTPQNGFGLIAVAEGGTQLFDFRLTSTQVNELRSKLSAGVTDEEKH
jgi:hypothetical protein